MFGYPMFPDALRPFNTQYRCYSVSMLPGQERTDVERGGKIIMPPSALDQLTRLNVVYPMLFKLTNRRADRVTHCGVLEFVADEGKVYLPYWMMRNLLLEEGALLTVESVSLPVATFSKFQPQSPDFLDITNPKAVLENALRNFACLTALDVIAIPYNQKVYEFCVQETKPGPAVSIIECDMNVEFAAPVGYQEPERVSRVEPAPAEEHEMPEPTGFVPFQGSGLRLDGKQKNLDAPKASTSNGPRPRGVPDYDYQMGNLRFLRNAAIKPLEAESEEAVFSAFSGEGRKLKQPKHRRP